METKHRIGVAGRLVGTDKVLEQGEALSSRTERLEERLEKMRTEIQELKEMMLMLINTETQKTAIMALEGGGHATRSVSSGSSRSIKFQGDDEERKKLVEAHVKLLAALEPAGTWKTADELGVEIGQHRARVSGLLNELPHGTIVKERRGRKVYFSKVM